MPTCTGAGSTILYYEDGVNATQIYNFDPSQPISSTNPTLNAIALPTGAGGLSVNENLNNYSPSPTFYTIEYPSGDYAYYNGVTWVNTGYTIGSQGNIGGGGNYIFNYSTTNGGSVYKYDGTANASQILSGLGSYIIGDVAVDCAENFYLLDVYTGQQWLKKYNSSGTLLNTWSVSGATSAMGGGSFAIIGNHVYYNGNAIGFWSGVINSSIVSVTQISSVTTSGLGNAPEFASCPFGAAIATANFDTIWHCAGGIADTLIGYGTDTLSWAVLSGPATLSGIGDTVTVTSTGNARLVLSSTATAICGSNTDTVQLIYVPAYTLGINSNSPLCLGDSLHLSGTSTQSGVSFHWNGPNSFLDSIQNTYKANTVFADSGYYVLSTDYHGCDAIDSILVHVKPMPALPLAGSNSPLCAGDTLKLHISNPQSGVSYSWAGPNTFSSSAQNPIRTNVVLIDSGKYRVKATLNGCSSGYDTTEVVINVVVVPNVSISSSPGIIIPGHVDTFTATTNCGGATYQWYKNGIAIPGATNNPYLTLLATGDIISVKLHCNGCANPDTALSNSLTTVNVETLGNPVNIKIYPNPFTNELNIHYTSSPLERPGEVFIKICDIVGREVYRAVINTSSPLERSGEVSISTSIFTEGTYILELINLDGEKLIKKIVK